jgi:cell division protein FtsQ
LTEKEKRQTARNRVKKGPGKKKPVNWRSLLRWLLRGGSALAFCAVLGLGWVKLYRLGGRTTWLKLETVEISPLKRLTRNEIVSLAGVKPGDSMFGLKLKAIVAGLSKNPWVEQVQVRRYFPHTLSITLTERTPLAVANVGCLYYLDGKGKLFKSLVDGDRLDYPLITGVSEDDLGRDPEGSSEALKVALGLIDILKGRKVFGLEDVSEIHYDKGYGFTLFTMQGGVPVKLGDGGFNDKLARFSGIYPQLKAQMQGLDYIDLDYGDRIIVKKV